MTTLVYIDEVLAVARQIVETPDDGAIEISAGQRFALAAAVIHQHEMIVAAGLRYPRPSAVQARQPVRPGTGARS